MESSWSLMKRSSQPMKDKDKDSTNDGWGGTYSHLIWQIDKDGFWFNEIITKACGSMIFTANDRWR